MAHPLGMAAVIVVGARIVVGRVVGELSLRELKSDYKLQSHIRQVREHFGTMRAIAVTGAVVDAYIDRLRTAGKASATINRYTQVLGAAFALAVPRSTTSRAVPENDRYGRERRPPRDAQPPEPATRNFMAHALGVSPFDGFPAEGTRYHWRKRDRD